METMKTSSNFNFLQDHNPVFYQIGSAAESAFAGDPWYTAMRAFEGSR